MAELYVIVDPEHCRGRDPLWVAERALEGGARVLQLRAKQLADRPRLALAVALAERCRAAGVALWINDRADIALACGAAGLHLGQDDLPLAVARRLVGAGVALGLSTHSPGQAAEAATAGADLIGFGPVFATRSKRDPDPCVGLEALRAVRAATSLPVVAIGGIAPANARQVADTGVHYAAVISAVCGADDPCAAARTLTRALR